MSLEELELWVWLGEWPTEGSDKSHNVHYESVCSVRLWAKCSALSRPYPSAALDWEFDVGDTWGCGGFEGQTSSFLPSDSCVEHISLGGGRSAGLGESGRQGGRMKGLQGRANHALPQLGSVLGSLCSPFQHCKSRTAPRLLTSPPHS